LDPIYFGDYPETMRQRLGDNLPKLSEKDQEYLRNSIDFLGLNHYTTRFISHVDIPREIHFYQVQEMERNGT
jgi:beta-glucosidase